MNTTKKHEIFSKLEIGQIALVQKWLDKYCLPYKKETIKKITDENGYAIAFEVLLDKNIMLKDYENESIVPVFIKNGSIRINITL
ncbi:MAG: hypothetical protein ABR927_17340 [Bacteroidales bacterium]|jgi:D-alanine-D-alanine ligase-like ATP-grasp enzyme